MALLRRSSLLLTASALMMLPVVLAACGDDDDPSGQSAAQTTVATAGAASTTTAPPSDADTLEWHRLELGIASTYVLVRGDDVAVVDPGVPGTETKLEPELKKLGYEWGDVDAVVATHQHNDHAGAVDATLQAATGATGYAGTGDVAAITSTKPLTGLDDGDTVFGMQVVGAPGHTPGSIVLYDEASGVLIVGDTFNRDGDAIAGPRPQFTADMAQAEASLRKLAQLNFDIALFGHAAPLEQGADDALAAYVATL
jgi:glyoxylase-like metal-dependent hydrolase (beta-lactamase superfamily II)